MGIGKLCGGDTFLIGGVQSSVTDIVHDGSGKEMGVLEDDSQRAAQIGLADFIDVDAVIADFAVLDIVKAVDQVRNRRLSCSGAAYEGKLLAGSGVHPDIMKDHLFIGISEVHAVKGDVTLKLHISRRAVRFVIVLPGPEPCLFFCLNQRAVRIFFGIDQLHIAIVLFGLLVHHPENALGSRQRHQDVVHLLADLGDGLGTALVQAQEGDQRSYG